MTTIRELPEEMRPRERLMQYGPEVMSTAELIAIVLGNGTKGVTVLQLAYELIHRFGADLFQATIEELCQIKGMGKAKAVQLKAALSLAERTSQVKKPIKYRIHQPEDVYQLIKDDFKNEKRELFMTVLLDIKSFVICRKIISIGTLNQTLVHSREVFHSAIRHNAASLVLAHNHPSGDPTPSEQDRIVTDNLIKVGEVMGIPIRDHIIIGDGRYLSFKEENLSKFY